jgi:rare lipoprotein A
MVAVVSAEEGTASWYSVASCKREGTWQKYGGKTASGEIFDDKKLTCAMRSRNFGKYYKVTNIKTGKFVIVKHNDFGPNKKLWDKGRKIDLSRSAFEKIENLTKGIVNVKIEPIQ